jgi:hypothetical protein
MGEIFAAPGWEEQKETVRAKMIFKELTFFRTELKSFSEMKLRISTFAFPGYAAQGAAVGFAGGAGCAGWHYGHRNPGCRSLRSLTRGYSRFAPSAFSTKINSLFFNFMPGISHHFYTVNCL